MEADDARIIQHGRVAPHHWEECEPVICDPGGHISADGSKAIREVFKTLRADERIKFHQFTCQMARTPVHLAVIEKIDKRLKAAGFGDT